MKRMLFNATQAEELRVAIVDGQKLIDLDIESAAKEQRKSNIYKGVITRIEPSLEAAFVDYGAERHGFLPFKEVSRVFFQPGVEAGRAKINEALKEGQEVIVQVDKDERGNKGAALTTFVSLAGRYLVLMPNNPRGGGVSRRIDGDERAELRETMDQLEVPQGMSLIARTAAIGRQAEELQWDLNYLLQLWRAIDGVATEQKGPLLIYQEGSLVIRAIRDYFQPEIGEILIDTDDIFEQAQAFMAQVMPGNVSRVKRYHDDVPLFSRFQIEHQIETAFAREVRLPSGGAIVIDHTEALVAVDVNSGRSTKGADIEETALKTNLEAADELARQLRLRDLGGLIVIDFIDMEAQRNQREVENRLRDALRFDRARVQMGKISRFGLMELSRQRLRPALAETSYIPCPRCTGTGHIRSTESAALHILRILEEEAMKENTAAVHTQVPVDVATFLLNEKRADVQAIELRHRVSILLIPNTHLETPAHNITRLRHDDLNLEDLREPSYKMMDMPVEEVTKAAGGQAEAGKPRQEAAIKNITPAQPAPVVEEKAVAAAPAAPQAQGGFFAKIMAFFRSEPEPVAPAAPEPKQKGREGRRDRNEGRGRNRNGNRRDEERGERGERNRGERQNQQRPSQPATEAPQVAQEKPQQSAAPKEPQQRRSRRDRQQQGSRDNPETTTNELDTATTAQAVLTTPAATPEGSDEGNNARRGRNRGRRNRGERGERRNQESSDQPNLLAPELNAGTLEDSTPIVVVAESVSTERQASPVTVVVEADPTPVVVVPETPVAVAVVAEPAPVAEPVSPAPVEPTVVYQEAQPEPSTAPVVESAPAPVVEPVVQAEVPSAPPVIETAPVVAQPVVTSAPIDLSKALEESGLVLVQTAADSVAPVVDAPPAPVGRPRKQAAVDTSSNEPLQMVETGNK